MSDSKGAATKPPLNEWARIVNSHFLQSPYEGKDWDSVRKDLIDEGTAILAQEVKRARVDELERVDRYWTPENFEEYKKLLPEKDWDKVKLPILENGFLKYIVVDRLSELERLG